MRAVAVGLIGAVLALGGAQAASTCPVNRAEVTVKDTGERYAGMEVIRPDLVGQTFRVRRYSAVEDVRQLAHRDGALNLGYEAYDLRGKVDGLYIKRERSATAPAVAAISWTSATGTTERAHVDWGKGRPERVKVGQTLDYVFDGPLTSLTLVVSACR
jgi:hypothetical protein